MNYTITKNAEFGSVEISFDGKPAQEVRDALKALKFRWHGQKKVWYGYADEETVRAAIEEKPIEAEKPTTKAPTIDKEMLRREFSKAWDSPEMIDFCINNVAAVAVLPGGEIITVDKQGIKKTSALVKAAMTTTRHRTQPPTPEQVKAISNLRT